VTLSIPETVFGMVTVVPRGFKSLPDFVLLEPLPVVLDFEEVFDGPEVEGLAFPAVTELLEHAARLGARVTTRQRPVEVG